MFGAVQFLLPDRCFAGLDLFDFTRERRIRGVWVAIFERLDDFVEGSKREGGSVSLGWLDCERKCSSLLFDLLSIIFGIHDRTESGLVDRPFDLFISFVEE